ncbi:MAG: chitin disaccharide deacetylase [Bacilli bacterium]|nr:chitin disaccharide deacetylase [Bacilli bacterium]
MIKKLIVNADDFGISEGATIGTLLAHKNGILTSTTCMMNMPYIEKALELAKDYPDLGLGIHFVLTVGKPLVKGAKSFVDENGYFRRPSSYEDGNPHGDEEEVYEEWKAQMEKFIALTGHKPSHIDSHHHVHMLPWHHHVVIRLAKEYDLPIRQREQIIDTYEYVPVTEEFYNQGVSIETIKKVLDTDNEYLELMTHTALLDQRLYEMSSYNLHRIKELEIITSQEIKNYIKDNKIDLINYNDIVKK